MAQQVHNFADLPAEYANPEHARVVIVPVPYDGTSTWGKGADKGPSAIIEASAHMELYDIETDSEVYRYGIFTDSPVQPMKTPDDVAEAVRCRVSDHIRKNRFVVTIGGEHSISIGSVKAHVESYDDLTVLQLDAHADLRDEYEGFKYNHACVMARIRELCPIIQVGIRSMDSCEKPLLDAGRVFLAQDIHNKSDWIEDAVTELSDNVYITIDLDVFDAAIMPSTGTPEPGGLAWYDVLALLKAVCDSKNVAGFDVTELCPNESNKAPDFLAAKLIYKLLSYRFRGEDAKKGLP